MVNCTPTVAAVKYTFPESRDSHVYLKITLLPFRKQ